MINRINTNRRNNDPAAQLAASSDFTEVLLQQR